VQQRSAHPACESAAKESRPYPPCQAACPVHIDVQTCLSLIAQGRYGEAFEVIHSVNPMAATSCFICHHPCEQECRRSAVDEPLAVRHLKRFALEQAMVYRRNRRGPVPQTRSQRIAIIGSGPAGLTAASDLADLGYKVTIFERNAELGGMLSSAIPPYRLPREALREDIDDILAKGVEARTNCQIGGDLTLKDLAAQHEAVLIAAGLSQSRALNIPGVEGPGILLALPFLDDVAHGRRPELGEKILVIGGGNVAIDVARSARRLGREKVGIVCLESTEEMPCWEWEIQQAMEEGIKIAKRWAPKAVRRSSRKVVGLETVKVRAVFDEAGRFNPTFHEDRTSFIEADTIIITIGQVADLSFLKDGPTKVDERGRLIWDRATQMSSARGVFVAGEVATGPGAAIQAVASGHRAAKAIHLFLQGEDVEAAIEAERKAKIAALPQDVAEKIIKQSRENVELVPGETRCLGFTQFEIGYDEETALKEARRCRNCGAGAIVVGGECATCLTCLRICPYGAPVMTEKAEIPPEKCQACGLCAPECPGRAIRMVGYDVDELRADMPQLIGPIDSNREQPILVAFVCGNHAGVNGDAMPENIRLVRVHCASRVGVEELLKALECGADGAYVVLCGEESCKYKGVISRIKGRVHYARELLAEMGLEKERIDWFVAAGHPDEKWRKAAQEMTEKVNSFKGQC
jgi:formate dehydrogenase beta subunit